MGVSDTLKACFIVRHALANPYLERKNDSSE